MNDSLNLDPIASAKCEIEVQLDVLEMILACDDESIADNPDDPRDRRGRVPGFERYCSLVPIVLRRLDEDLAAKRIGLGETDLVLTGLSALLLPLRAFALLYEHDQPDRAVEELQEALVFSERLGAIPRDDHPGRLYRDIDRLFDDVRAARMSMGFTRSHTRDRPDPPEGNAQWSPYKWFDFFLGSARREDPMIDAVERQGLTEPVLREAHERSKKQGERLEEGFREFLEADRIIDARDAAYDEKNPEAFLELREIPVLPAIADGEPEPYEIPTRVCPETSAEERDPNEWESDPVFLLVRPFTSRLIIAMKDQSSLAYGYMLILAVKSQATLASADIWLDQGTGKAPIFGAYRFVMHNLGRIAETVDCFALDPALAADARRISAEVATLL